MSQEARVLVACLVSFVIGAGSMFGVAAQEHKKDVSRVEQQSLQERDKLVGRIAELEDERTQLRRDVEDRDARLAAAAERDRARQVRASRSRRATASPALVWTHSRHGIQIANCESADLNDWPWSDGSRYLGGEKGVHLHDQPLYTGKWQIGPDEWRDWGGLRFAPAPYLATELEQDIVAEEGYRRRKEQPWVCSRKV